MLVVDASVIVDLLVHDDAAQLAAALEGETLIAPTLIDVEVVSALRGLVLGGHLSEPRARDALADLADLPLRRAGVTAQLREAVWGLRDRHSAYDAAYVALAILTGAPLLTRDAKILAGAPAEAIVRVV